MHLKIKEKVLRAALDLVIMITGFHAEVRIGMKKNDIILRLSDKNVLSSTKFKSDKNGNTLKLNVMIYTKFINRIVPQTFLLTLSFQEVHINRSHDGKYYSQKNK